MGERVGVLDDLLDVVEALRQRLAPAKRRLSRGRQNDRAAVDARELSNGVEYTQQEPRRNRLGLVDDDDASCDVVQLAAARWAVGEERLEELHARCHDDWRVPV